MRIDTGKTQTELVEPAPKKNPLKYSISRIPRTFRVTEERR